jgi:hypothetical protein
MTDISEQHKASFASVSAYVVLKGGERVATVAFKFPRDGAGRLYAYVHWIGTEMVRGHAGGYGYSKCDAAVSVAAKKLRPIRDADFASRTYAADKEFSDAFINALLPDNGYSWDRHLRDAGFDVMPAV